MHLLILIVSNNADLVKTMRASLHRVFPDVDIQCLTTCDEAQRLFEADGGDPGYDVVIVDGYLPDGNGSVLINTLVMLFGHHLPYVLMSGDPKLPDKEWLLRKPFVPKELQEMVEKRLGVAHLEPKR